MSNDWKFDHAVMIVRDIGKTFEHYKSLGMDVFLEPSPGAVKDCKVNGEIPETTIKFQVAYLKCRDFLLKLIQPLEGESDYQEYLDKYGEGIAHLHFYVPDFEKEKVEMNRKGFPTIFEVGHHTHSEAHFDTSEFGNTNIELRQGSYVKLV